MRCTWQPIRTPRARHEVLGHWCELVPCVHSSDCYDVEPANFLSAFCRQGIVPHNETSQAIEWGFFLLFGSDFMGFICEACLRGIPPTAARLGNSLTKFSRDFLALLQSHDGCLEAPQSLALVFWLATLEISFSSFS
jgi:hypothetical protein